MAHIEANSRITTQVIERYINKLTEPLHRKSKFYALLKSKSRVMFNCDSYVTKWPLRFRRRTITPVMGDPNDLQFEPMTTIKWAQLPWRGYTMTERVTKFERLVSQGGSDVTKFKIFETALGQMAGDFIADFRLKLYGDGNAGSANDLMGLESWFGTTGSPITNSLAAAPSDSYAGLNTVLGTYGGSWTADSGNGYPTGYGDTEYNFCSPLVVDYGNSGWVAGTKTWPNTWQEAIRYGLTYQESLQSVTPDIIILTPELKRQAKDSLGSVQKLELTANSQFIDIPFKTLNFEGTEVISENGVPAGVGYMLSLDELSLQSMQSQLLVPSKDWDIESGGTDLLLLDFYGQLFCNSPAFQCKLLDL